MGVLTEWIILSLVGLLIYGVLRVMARLWGLAVKKQEQKLSEAYKRAVEGQQQSDTGVVHPAQVFIDGKALEDVNDLKIQLEDLRKIAQKKASKSTGNFLSVPISLTDFKRNLWDSDPITPTHGMDFSPDDSQDVSGISHYDGAGHGGSFGGGGASASWGSDDSSSSSYSDSSSSDSGSSDSGSSD